MLYFLLDGKILKGTIELRDDGYCFVCGPLNPVGLHLSFKKSGEKVTASFVPQKIHQGYADIVHGGLIAAVLDEVMVKACILNGVNAMTAEMSVRFKRPLKIGISCTAEAWLISRSQRLIEAESIMRDQDGNTIALAKAKLIPSTEQRD